MLKFESIIQIFNLNLENRTDRLSRSVVKPLKTKVAQNAQERRPQENKYFTELV
jgi:hypothetical protein